MKPEFALALVTAAPLLTAFIAWSRFGRRILSLAGVVAVLPAIAVALFLPTGSELWLAKGHLEIVLALDDLGKAFLGFTSVGWALAAAYAVSYLHNHARRTGFWVLFLLAMSGNFLLITGVDALSYYSGFAVMGFASWGLVALEATPSAIRAGRIYLGVVVLGELLVLPGLVKGVLAAESTRLAAIQAAWGSDVAAWLAVGLLVLGFGIKAGMFPFHFWLPVAHPAAPTPASAVLSGCMIKAGLLGWLRLLPTGGVMLPYLAILFAVVGFINLVGGGLVGITQKLPKAALAYSSLQAMGTLMLMVAATMWNPSLRETALPLITAYATFHALHKVSLFLAVGVLPAWRRGWHLATFLLVFVALSYSAVPGLAGYRAKTAIEPLWDAVPDNLETLWAAGLDVGTALTLILMARVVWTLRPKRENNRSTVGASAWVWTASSLFALSFVFLLTPPAAASPISLRKVLPLLLGALLCATFFLPVTRLRFTVPPGDVGVLLGRISSRGLSKIGAWTDAAESSAGGPAAALAVLALLIILLLSVRPFA